MEKLTIFENIGGFIISPRRHTLNLLKEENRVWKSLIIQSSILIMISSIFSGVVLMFYMMYPEVFFVPHAEHIGNLFVYAAAHPIFILAILGLGIILVVIFDILVQGSISYWLTKRTLKNNNKTLTLPYSRFIALYSFTNLYTMFFYMITVLWIYFFEKFAYTKIFFPVTDLTLPVIIQFTTLIGLLILKWIWEIKIKIGIFQWAEIGTLEMRESIIISLCVRLWLVTIIFMVLYFSSNLIAGAQWS